ncbi:hexokinase-like [Planococcus citri]|uniref:hexokinase-like n=1 Tax=Planococcus citri TaxID=170843 RepID=UPI0031FA082A
MVIIRLHKWYFTIRENYFKKIHSIRLYLIKNMAVRAVGTKKSCVIKEMFAPFKLSNETLCSIMNRLLTSINQGLSKDTHTNAPVKCYQTYIYDFPTGDETGKFLAIDFGGANFRILVITLEKGRSYKVDSRTYVFPDEKLEGNADEFFDYIVECLRTFREELNLGEEKLPLGFCFSFPVQQKSLNSGILTRWSKRFNIKGAVGKDVGELFQKALERQNMIIRPFAILNDTTGCLLSCSWSEPTCRVGVIIGTGTNACYYEKRENIELYNGKPDKPGMVINTEWGNFGADGSLNDIITEFDRQLDTGSLRPGSETFEKMVSVMYVCELIRLSIVKCTEMKYLFGGEVVQTLKNKGSFLPDYLYSIENDDADLRKTMGLFESLKCEHVSIQDCVNVRYITHTICKRSAHLLSAAIATIINKMSVTPSVVGIDGGFYRNHSKYSEMITEKIRCMINPNIQFSLVLSEDGSGRGAALAVVGLKE